MPLLQDGQDPDGLAALVAYHLHRLGITLTQLTQAGVTDHMARHLRRGTLPMKNGDTAELAAALQLHPNDLTRNLSDDEKAEWRFYRVSARQVTAVWKRVAEASTAHNFSQRQISKLLDMPQSVINRVMRGERKSPVLNWHDAAKLAEALQLSEGADTFIPPAFSSKNERDLG